MTDPEGYCPPTGKEFKRLLLKRWKLTEEAAGALVGLEVSHTGVEILNPWEP